MSVDEWSVREVYPPVRRWSLRENPTLIYDPASVAYFAAMTVQPTFVGKVLINNLIAGLIFDGVWPKLDWLSLLASHDAQAARLNAVDPSVAASVVNTPNFTVNRGYAAAQGTNSYLTSNWDPATNGAHYQQDSAHMSVWINAGTGSGEQLGSASARINARSGGGLFQARINAASATTFALASGMGFSAIDRSAASAGKLLKSGSEVATFSTASTALTTDDFFIGCYNNAGVPASYSAARVAAMSWGAHLTDAEHLLLYTRLRTYLTAIGAQ